MVFGMQASLRLRSLDGRRRGNIFHIFDVRSQNLRHAPGLRYIAARQLRGVAIEDFTVVHYELKKKIIRSGSRTCALNSGR